MRSIDIAAEFNRLNIEYTVSGEHLIVLCPYHEDTNPSCSVDSVKQNFKCRACGVYGDIFTLIAKITKRPKHQVLAELDTTDDKPVEISVIQREHSRIWSAPDLLKALHKRGVSNETIKRFFLGEQGGRIIIPIPNANGMYVNQRKYLPSAVGVPKMLNQKGRSKLRLFPFAQLQYPDLVLCAGEIKALAVAQRLNTYNIGAICITGGENDWNKGFNQFFEGKKVWILSDIDDTGIRSAEFRCIQLRHMASWLGRVDLPLDPAKFPTGDVNDFIAENNYDLDGQVLLALLQATEPWVSKVVLAYDQENEAEPSVVSIKEAMHPEMVLKRFSSRVAITSLGQDPYYIPKMVKFSCTKDQTGCSTCPLFDRDAEQPVQVPPESTSILAMMESDVKNQTTEIKLGLQLPPCDVVMFETVNNYKVLEARLQREMTLAQQDSDKTVVSAVLIDIDPEINETYAMEGRALPHPKTQRSTAMVSKATAVVDALSGFELTDPDELLAFRPDEWTVDSITERLNAFYTELAVNVTKIYDRQPMHQIIDLAYHSMLSMRVENKVRKAWVEVLIVGDSEQGKSDVADNMLNFYELGEKVDCKNATRAGILGGTESINGKWWIQWGLVPKNDRKLVFLEELKGLSQEVFAKLTEMRSSGWAQIPQIARGRVPARTRLVALSNPRKSHNLDSYSYGVNAITELIGSPEDIRRFDISAIINRNEIATKVVTQHRKEIPATFTADQCRRLILWCWTRSSDEVVFADDTIDTAIVETNLLCDDFTDAVPILGRAGTKLKLLRLAAALAGKLFSSDADYKQVIVRPCHVQWISQFLRAEYSKPAHGYLELSSRGKRRETLLDEAAVRAQFAVVNNQTAVVEHFLYTDSFDQQDICNWCAWGTDEARLMISVLVRNNAVQRDGASYKKVPAFTKLLRELREKPIQKPEHIEEKEVSDVF